MMRTVLFLFTLWSAPLVWAIEPLVNPDWLHERLNDSQVVVLDIRYVDDFSDHEFAAAHVPGAIFQSYRSGWRTTQNGVPGMLPEPEQLAELIGGLGISNSDQVVIVSSGTSSSDFGAAARIYWTFKVLGHTEVGILNGGFAGWQQAGLPTASGAPQPRPTTTFAVDFQPQWIATAEDVTGAEAAGVQLVDARPIDFFFGRQQSPAARVAGTIPGSLSLPEDDLVVANGDAYFLTAERLLALMDEAAVKYDAGGTITFCNTGHWAATDWFALSEIAGLENVAMYDGSMADWTADESRSVQTERRGLGRFLNWF
jgi:thiosulfate/3-mercaptopyruvate sulfurtransferase